MKKKLFSFYQQVRDMRDTNSIDSYRLSEISRDVSDNHPDEWLLHLEIAELVKDLPEESDLEKISYERLEELKGHSEEYRNLIRDGLGLI